MITISARLKDVFWSLRQRFGLGSDIDQFIRYLAFEQDLTEEKFNDLFVPCPKRVPQDYRSALLARIFQIVRLFWEYQRTKKGLPDIFNGVLSLEDVVRYGLDDGCDLKEDPILGWQLHIKPRFKDKK